MLPDTDGLNATITLTDLSRIKYYHTQQNIITRKSTWLKCGELCRSGGGWKKSRKTIDKRETLWIDSRGKSTPTHGKTE